MVTNCGQWANEWNHRYKQIKRVSSTGWIDSPLGIGEKLHHLGGTQIRVTTPPNQEEPLEIVWVLLDTSLGRCFWGRWIRQKPHSMPRTCWRDYICHLATCHYSPGRDGRDDQEEGGLGLCDGWNGEWMHTWIISCSKYSKLVILFSVKSSFSSAYKMNVLLLILQAHDSKHQTILIDHWI